MDRPSILSGEKVSETKIPIIKPNFDEISSEIAPHLQQILESNMVTGVNRIVKEFEKNVSDYFQTPSIAISSCTAGMVLTMEGLGIRNKEVIVPSFSFSATAHMAYWTNNRIVFADIARDTLNLDPESVKRMISDKTAAILAVHMYGNPAPIKELQEIADEHDIYLLFDAAHAFGSKYEGKPIGNFGEASSFSLSPTKIISTVEGGIVSSKNEDLLEKLDLLRNYGNDPNYNCPIPGLNARMSELYAAIGNAFLPLTDTFVKNRNHYISIYKKALEDIPGIYFQEVKKGNVSTYKDFCIFIDKNEFGLDRNQLGQCFEAANISFKYYFYPPIHYLDPYKTSKKDNLANTEWASHNVFSLPIWNKMKEETILTIADEIRSCHAYSHEIKSKL